MDTVFTILRQTRANVLALTRDLTPAQWLAVPTGRANHILWNVGHLAVTLELLTYGRCGLDLPAAGSLLEAYRKGSGPDDGQGEADIEPACTLLEAGVDRVEADYRAGVFGSFERYETSFGVPLTDIETALQFNNVHEGLHLGVIMALKKAVA